VTVEAKKSDLGQRVVTALILAAVVIGVLLSKSNTLWALLLTILCMAAAWEGGRLAKLSPSGQVAAFALVGFVILTLGVLVWPGGTHAAPLTIFLLVAAAFWILIVPVQLSRRAINLSSLLGRLFFPLLIGAAWLSAIALHRLGIGFLVAVVVITVVADIAGYFVGRQFGRVKLAPSISPGKTREGALGGVAAAAIWTGVASNYMGIATGSTETLAAALAGGVLGAFAVVGDLWESQLKRQAGQKDSSGLLPGHGGVLDRIDAQLAVLPLATLMLSVVRPMW
jgi:phosphatidate cytidylyltransferase